MNIEALLNALQADIQNLPAKVVYIDAVTKMAYKEGHRDARHAAAELVAAFASKLEGELK